MCAVKGGWCVVRSRIFFGKNSGMTGRAEKEGRGWWGGLEVIF